MEAGAMSGSSRWIVYAAGLLVVAGLAYGVVRMKQPRAESESPRVPEAPVVAVPATEVGEPPEAPAPPESDPVTGEMVKTRTELKAAYAERRGELPADVAKPIDDDIGVIEGAVADLLAAMVREPENEDLKRMLVATYRNEFRLLKKALHLSSEESEDEEEGISEEPPVTDASSSK